MSPQLPIEEPEQPQPFTDDEMGDVLAAWFVRWETSKFSYLSALPHLINALNRCQQTLKKRQEMLKGRRE